MEHTQYYAIQKYQSQPFRFVAPFAQFAKFPSKQENVSLR